MAITAVEKLQEAFSLAVEERSAGYSDLVTNSNAILYILKENGMWKTFSGPTIRVRALYNETGTYTRFTGYQFLNPQPAELFNDAEFLWKLAAVSVTLSGEDILKNSGRNQLKDIFQSKMKAGEDELIDRFVEDVHADGTSTNQIGGLQLAVPTANTTGTYGGFDRAVVTNWRTGSYDMQTDFPVIGTQVTATTIKPVMDNIMINHSRGKRGPDIIAMSKEHYTAYTAATVAIQRINDQNRLGELGFTSLKYYGAGKSVDVVLEGGIGTAMPANTTYFLDSQGLAFYRHPDRDFSAFGGKRQPVNQDAVVQHIGFMGNLVLSQPLHTAKLRDSNPAT